MFKSTKEYLEHPSDFIFYAFEPRFETCLAARRNAKYLNAITSNKAVWIEDGQVDYHTSLRMRGTANGIFKDPRSNAGFKASKSLVPCIDFSKWILNNFINDYVIIKMDIEGAEFDVLEKMIKDNSIKCVKIIYLEFHDAKRSDLTQTYRDDFKKRIMNIEGLECRPAIEQYKGKS
jgi:FkbM family methyltransferase